MTKSSDEYIIRQATPEDKKNILRLYKIVAYLPGGIAREYDEITENYVSQFMQNASQTGVELVAVATGDQANIIAEIHCCKLFPKVFRHVLSDLTVVVHPEYQGKGIGKKIFTSLLEFITDNRPDVLRVELIARESNIKAIEFYKQLGFVVEGRFEKRISGSDDEFEADIPMAWFNTNFVKENNYKL